MNITFLIPPELYHDQPAERSAGCTRVVYEMPNIYALTAAAVVEEQGHNVKWKDFSWNDKPTLELLGSWLETDITEVYFIWTVNLSLASDLEAMKLIRQKRPEALIVLLGPGATYFTVKSLPCEQIVVVRGEPEATVKELLVRLSNKEAWKDIKGISFLDNGSVKNNPSRELINDLDALPFPARHLVSDREYHNPKLKISPYTTLFTSRNCPYHCIYCVPSSLTFAREIEYKRIHGRKPPIGFRSVESVTAELELLHQQGFKAIGFVDDNFIWNEKRTAAICQTLQRLGMVWGCQARVDAITEPIARLLSQSGCGYVDLGVESFDDRILEYIRKGITTSQIYTAIELLKKYRVPVKLNVLIGSSPLETKKTLRHTLREAKRLGVDQVMFNIVSPFPGTEFYTLCKENGWLETPDYVPTDVQRRSILKYPHLSAEDMEKILFRSNLSYFLRPSYIFHQLRQFHNLKELGSALKAVRIKLFGKK